MEKTSQKEEWCAEKNETFEEIDAEIFSRIHQRTDVWVWKGVKDLEEEWTEVANLVCVVLGL